MTTSRGLVAYSLLLVLAGGMAALTGLVLLHRSAAQPPGGQQQGTVSAAQLRLFFVQTGLTPDVLAAAGVTASQATSAVGYVRSHFADIGTPLASADAAFQTANRERERIRGRIRAHAGDRNQALASLSTTEAQQGSAAGSRQNAREAALNGLAEVLGAERVQVLRMIRDNQRWQVPVYFRVVNRTEAQWVRLQSALSTRAASTQAGDPVPQEVQAAIAAAEADANVAAAKASFESNQAAVSEAVNTAVRQ